jgi:arsenical pump membrane protein
MPASAFLSIGIFVLTLVLVLCRPRGLNEAWFTSLGALLMLVCHIVTVGEAVQTVTEGANVLGFLLALMVLSALLDRAGFFEWAAIWAALTAKGNGKLLYRNVFVLGAMTTAVLSLDTTAIILTPIVVAFVQRLKLKARPFLIACAFVANTGSLLFPISNLTNLLYQETFQYSFVSFTQIMVVPQIVALSINYWLFRLIFKKSIPEDFDQSLLPSPTTAIADRPFFFGALVVLFFVVISYFIAALNHVPPVVVATIGSVILLAWAIIRKQADRGILKDIAWSLFPFIVGLFIVIRGVENIGLAELAGKLATECDGQAIWGLPALSCATAIGSNIINNIPMALLSISALKNAHCGVADQYAALIGCNLGPNLTIAGSLATMLVISSARKRGEHLGPMEFLRIGLITTPALVLGTSFTLKFLTSFGLAK